MKRLITIMALFVVIAAGCSAPAPPTQLPRRAAPPPPDPPQVKGIFIDGEAGGDAETLNWILARRFQFLRLCRADH